MFLFRPAYTTRSFVYTFQWSFCFYVKVTDYQFETIYYIHVYRQNCFRYIACIITQR